MKKDPIDWKESKYQQFYTKLNQLKDSNKALLNGEQGGDLVYVSTENDKEVLSFTREKDNDKILVIANLNDKAVTTTLKGENLSGDYKNYFTGGKKKFSSTEKVKLGPWEYLVFTN